MDFKLLYKYFEGSASKEEVAKIKLWLESSPENMQILLLERKIYDSVLLNNGEKETSIIQNNKRKKIIWEVLKIASVILITALTSVLYFNINEGGDDVAMQTISVPAGQRLNINLPDGTNVWLNAKTTIKYPVSFNKKERLVEVDGQAYFSVAKDDKKPFIVNTRSGRVQALGTKFDVLDYSDDSIFETMLSEGKVKVDMASTDNQTLILEPNTKAFIRNGKLNKERIEDKSEYEWRNGLLSFRNKSFTEIMKSFEKIYDIKIVIEDPRITNQTLTAKFRIVDGVDYALRVLQREINFQFRHDNEDRDIEIIYIKPV